MDKEELNFQMKSHPSYPSLHSITGVLDHFNIPNVAARIPSSLEVMEHIPNNFIAQLKIKDQTGLFLIDKKGQSFSYIAESGDQKSFSIEDFFGAFTGIILAVEIDESEKEISNSSKLNPNYYLLAIGIALFCIFVFTSWGLIPLIQWLLAVLGVVLSIAIVQQELGVSTKIGQMLCNSNSETKDCHAVLVSKGAKLPGSKKLSDLSLVYFLGLSCGTFLLEMKGYSLQLVFLINLLALPITLYSIYYQAYVVKRWCMLCLGIVSILWLLALLPFLASSFSPVDTVLLPHELLLLFMVFAVSFSLWGYLSPKVKTYIENKEYKLEYFKFKRDYRIFSSLLKHQQVIDTSIEGLNDMTFGNSESKLEVLIVTNPFCKYCQKAHQIMEDILNSYSEDVKLVIRFQIGPQNTDSEVYKITADLLYLYHNRGPKICLQAMHELFGLNELENWKTKWRDLESIKEKEHRILEEQSNWCKRNKLNFTPAILINGLSFPKTYERKELLFFIEDLIEEYNR